MSGVSRIDSGRMAPSDGNAGRQHGGGDQPAQDDDLAGGKLGRHQLDGGVVARRTRSMPPAPQGCRAGCRSWSRGLRLGVALGRAGIARRRRLWRWRSGRAAAIISPLAPDAAYRGRRPSPARSPEGDGVGDVAPPPVAEQDRERRGDVAERRHHGDLAGAQRVMMSVLDEEAGHGGQTSPSGPGGRGRSRGPRTAPRGSRRASSPPCWRRQRRSRGCCAPARAW